jgi:hypothetical protein
VREQRRQRPTDAEQRVSDLRGMEAPSAAHVRLGDGLLGVLCELDLFPKRRRLELPFLLGNRRVTRFERRCLRLALPEEPFAFIKVEFALVVGLPAVLYEPLGLPVGDIQPFGPLKETICFARVRCGRLSGLPLCAIVVLFLRDFGDHVILTTNSLRKCGRPPQ